MDKALSLARDDLAHHLEVPVGAAIVQVTGESTKLVATSTNRKECLGCPTAHAEMSVIQKAAKITGSWRLSQCILYATIEPCFMCAGAIIHARLPMVVYGARNTKFGALGSLYDLSKDHRLNHKLQCLAGVRESEATDLIQLFFRKLREQKNKKVRANHA